MAKSRGRGGSKQADKEAVPLSSLQLREWATELRDLADTLESRASDMDVLDASPVMVFVKSFTNAAEAQWGWVAKQLVPKLLSVAADKGRRMRIQLEAEDRK